MAKKVLKQLKLLIPAAGATPAPPIGPTLAPYGISTAQFCSQFNEKTKEMNGVLTPVILSIYDDRTFTFILKTPPVSELIRRELNIKKGSAKPNLDKVGHITKAQIDKIIGIKSPDLNTEEIEKARKIIAGTAMQMGITIEK